MSRTPEADYGVAMKTTTPEQDPRAAAKLHELIDGIAVAMLVTVTPDGALRSRPMMTQQMSEGGSLWFFTAKDSPAAEDLAEEQAVNVAYADPEHDRYVSVSGQGSFVTERAKLEELWSDALRRFFPQGLDDPRLTLLQVRVESAEYWDAAAGRMTSLHEAGEAETGAARRGGGRDLDEAIDRTEHAKVDIRATPTSG